MGKKSRKEREIKRDSFATQRTKEKTKHTLIAVAVLGAIGVIVGISAYNFVSFEQVTPGAPPGAGTLGSEHVHASFLAKLHRDNCPASYAPTASYTSTIVNSLPSKIPGIMVPP